MVIIVRKWPRLQPPRSSKTFLAKYTPEMHAEMKAAHAKMRKLVPGAVEMVYDNWNGLVVGFGPTERASEAVLSLIVLPDHVTLCFLKGKKLPGPGQAAARRRECRPALPPYRAG